MVQEAAKAARSNEVSERILADCARDLLTTRTIEDDVQSHEWSLIHYQENQEGTITLLVRPVEYPTVSYIMSDPATEPFS